MNKKPLGIIIIFSIFISIIASSCDTSKIFSFNNGLQRSEIICDSDTINIILKRGLSTSDWIYISKTQPVKVGIESLEINSKKKKFRLRPFNTFFLVEIVNYKLQKADTIKLKFQYGKCLLNKTYTID